MNSPNAGQLSNSEGASTWKRFARYGPLVLWMGFIWSASTRQFSALNTSTVIRPLILWFFPDLGDDQVATIHSVIRKSAHFFEYAILALLARRAFITSSQDFIRRYWFQLAFLLVAGYALLDEFHQSLEPSRTGSLYDSAIDVAGGLTVLLVCRFFYKRPPTARKPAADAPIA